MLGLLGEIGKVEVLETPYNAFRGKSQLQQPANSRDGAVVSGGERVKWADGTVAPNGEASANLNRTGPRNFFYIAYPFSR